MKASDYIAAAISGVGVNHIFGYTGGMVAHLIDSIDKNPSLEMINMITEQGAGFAAEGYAKNSNKLGVAIATSGPGAINLLTPMAGCYFDSVPVLFITGQVNSNEYRKFKKIRQNGFQEANIIDMANPITKYANFIDSPLKLAEELHKAMHIAKTGRKGPVLLDIPMDIQRAEINDFSIPSFEEKNYADGKNDSIVELIRLSKRPVLLVGGGVRLSGAAEE
ncbi:MAG: hypothetical protein LBT67_00255 [Holosporaceae bacterium]|jgi:acetolactate synthase-1/2/3 large subunit|nr:hypothetical protein [Holosporaceae bacterium]